jgi:hypothetical protein
MEVSFRGARRPVSILAAVAPLSALAVVLTLIATGDSQALRAAKADPLKGYKIVSKTVPELFAQNSGGQRGLSEVKTVKCKNQRKAIGGGADLGTNATQNGQQRQMILSASFPTPSGNGWSVQLFNNSTSIDSSLDVEIYAVCTKVG